MPYQYGMQNSPSGGNGLGGLPKKQTTPTQVTYTKVLGVQALTVTPTTGTIVPPANAKYMRVAAIGAGGSADGASGSGGGGGGGCAASKIVPAAPISYYIINADGQNGDGTIAVFPGYRLFGGRGGAGHLGRAAGTASGGDYNYVGGTGSSSLAGGGAGPNGNGQNAGTSGAPPLGNSGWGVGGGGSTGFNTGAAGAGASVGASTSFLGATVWGKTNAGFVGGELGGGALNQSTSFIYGGVGGIVVEWFYD